MSNSTSTLSFKSNIYPLEHSPREDSEFLKHVHDPFSLKIMKQNGVQLNGFQQKEYEHTLHCSYADKDDYPWGTITLPNGRKDVVCKCTKRTCGYFRECRPNFDVSELDVYKENQIVYKEILSLERRNKEVSSKIASENVEVAKNLFSRVPVDLDSKVIDEKTTAAKPQDVEVAEKLFSEELVAPDSQKRSEKRTVVSVRDSKPVQKLFPEVLIEPDKRRIDKKQTIADVHDSKPVQKLFPEVFVEPDRQGTDEGKNAVDVQVEVDDVFFITSDTEPRHADLNVAPTVDFSSFVDTTQTVIIESEPTERMIVNAGPGTGKTWSLIEKIIYMVGVQGVSADEVLILCFSRAAVEVIKNRLVIAAEQGRIDDDWRKIDIRTFDSFATYMLAWVQQERPALLPLSFSLESNGYDERIKQATNVFRKERDILAQNKQIIVDEVQDLVGCRAEMVIALLSGLPETCGFTLLGDSCQALYDYRAINDPSIMASESFYHEIFRIFPSASYYALTENHRQGDELGTKTLPYRNAILNGTDVERLKIATDLFKEIPVSKTQLKNFTVDESMSYVKHGTLGILTRSNAQALQISAWLLDNKIDHDLIRELGPSDFGDWISKVFYNYEQETVDESSFVAHHRSVFPKSNDNVALARWNALINSQKHNFSRRRFEVKDLLFGIIRNSREPELYRSNGEKTPEITVSNIHRAKGREFDSVLLIDDVIQSIVKKQENDNILEHKVCYVALTRPKKRIEHVAVSDEDLYIRKLKNARSRCFRRKQYRRYISHFEVGAGDLDIMSFAVSHKCQVYIQQHLKPGMRLKLKKCSQGVKPYVTYSVTLEDQDNIILGLTGRWFAEELESAIQSIFENSSKVTYKWFPNSFCDVFVGDITSHISSEMSPEGAKSFGEVSIWSGFTIAGFAYVESKAF